MPTGASGRKMQPGGMGSARLLGVGSDGGGGRLRRRGGVVMAAFSSAAVAWPSR